MKLITNWLLSAASLLLVAYLYSGVEIKSYSASPIAALVIGMFNTVLRPILVILTPVSYTHLDVYKRQHTKRHPDRAAALARLR